MNYDGGLFHSSRNSSSEFRWWKDLKKICDFGELGK